MDNNKLQEKTVANDGYKSYTILNFHDFVIEEGKKDKEKTKKIKPIVKNRKDFIDDMGDDIIDPNDNPERYIKIREQFIKENYK